MSHLLHRAFGLWLLLEIFTLVVYLKDTDAATLNLTWVDNSTNEYGFKIERKLGVGGAYTQIATVGSNVTSYSDSSLADGTTYCYRVNAFNSAGASPYTPEACGTTPAVPIQNFTLNLSIQGGGSATSNPAGISCGTSCSASFASGTSVLLRAVPAQGYTFSGWSGDADCADGSVTMNSKRSCTAIFTANANDSMLTIQVVNAINPGGTGSGKVVTRPKGINCGTACSANFDSGAAIKLKAIPGRGSIFAGWSGDAECANASIVLTKKISCTATFKPQTYVLSVSFAGNGTGKMTSDPSGIDCSTNCSVEFAKRAKVKLTATPDADSFFSGWSGDRDCKDGAVTMKSDKSCAAVFTKRVPSDIGIYRPSTGAWYLATKSTPEWQGCDVNDCLGPLGDPEDLPIIGDWDGAGTASIGFYAPQEQRWKLVINGVTSLHGFTVPQTSSAPQVPVTGSWDGAGQDSVGIYQLDSNLRGTWYLDRNGNGTFDGCKVDRCAGPLGGPGDIPVVGDWNGDGVTEVGVFNPETGMWNLDYNDNGKWNGCEKDRCLGPFGRQGDIPVAGDWDGNGTFEIGVFRASTGEWFLDFNGNGQWDGVNVDKYVAGFGQQGDLPIVGKW